MSRRMNYAQNAARLVDWISEIGTHREGVNPSDAAVDYIVAELVGGLSVEDFIRQEALDWPTLSAWLKCDDKRRGRYEEALKDRKFMRHERLLDGWWKTAALKVERLPEHVDVHRAREALAKAEGLYKQGEGHVKGSITVTFDDVDSRA